MSDGKRMTAEREADIRDAVTRYRSEPKVNSLAGAYVDELLMELDAARVDLAELVAALPRCASSGCGNAATVSTASRNDANMRCDEHHTPMSGWCQLPWAATLRRLAKGTP